VSALCARSYVLASHHVRVRSVLRASLFAAALLLLAAPTVLAQGQRSAEISLAEAEFRRGERESPRRRALALIRDYERGIGASAAHDHIAAGRAYLLVATGDADAVRRALRAFDAAAAADPQLADAPLRAADLFLARYNAPDARAGYEDVLRRWPDHPRALLGMARVLEFAGDPGALPMARRAASADARLADAQVAIARLQFDAEAADSALVAARRAVLADRRSLEGWGFVAAVAWARGDSAGYRSALRMADSLSTRPVAFYVTLSEAAARQRRYREAEEFAARGVALDSLDVAALGALGNNRLRRGDLVGGRAALERAFAIDPFHLWHKNTLDLLDQMAEFRTLEQGRFVFVGPAREIDVLTPYLAPLLEEAYDELATRYGYRPPTPVRLELFDRHADFSVRTVGLTGLGALGVSFGTTLAMDAPSAREQGTFNWGSTAWHELAHTFTLGLSGHRVPRWFSEGISVLEERRAREGWGATPSPDFLTALRENRLRPVSQLNEGFVRPRDPGEVPRSYYLASLVCEMIEEQFGAPAFGQMLRAWGEGLETPQVFERVLKVDAAAMDARFSAWLAARFPRGGRVQVAAGDADLEPLLAAVEAARARGDAAAEVQARERVLWVWPYDIAMHEGLADAASRAGQPALAVRERRVVMALGPADALEARFRLAVALRDAGDRTAARREVLRVLEQAPTFQRAQGLLLDLRATPERP
jgi:tetratricopeptide (TPR) repeat protein